ncbi:MAG: hypothetical protein ACRDJC_19435 [Thermomicrobiales bacterium]
MFGEGHNDSIVRRGIDEALACQDMLARTPVRPSLLTQVVAWLGTTIRALADRDVARGQRATPAARRSVP